MGHIFLSLLSISFIIYHNSCSAKKCSALNIAHRGASGYVPEHTLGAYALAITMGADFIEPDLVITKDGHLIARHENQLGVSTDVAERPEFADRHTTRTVGGVRRTGWFTEDFTLEEIKTLRAVESNPTIRPGNTRMNGSFEIPTLEEIINLIKSMEVSERRTIGLYPEIKHSSHFQSIGLPMEQTLVEILHRHEYYGPRAPVFIQSFEVTNLKQLKNLTDIPLVQLISGNRAGRPADQVLLGTSLTYGEMATAEGLRDIANYAKGVGPDKRLVIPRTLLNGIGKPTSFVTDAHAVGLLVHPYTFRSENFFLPTEFTSNGGLTGIGNLKGELQAFIEAGVDGVFVDQPDILFQMRHTCNC